MSSETGNEQEVRSGLLSRFYLPQVISMFANVAIQPFPVIQIDLLGEKSRKENFSLLDRYDRYNIYRGRRFSKQNLHIL